MGPSGTSLGHWGCVLRKDCGPLGSLSVSLFPACDGWSSLTHALTGGRNQWDCPTLGFTLEPRVNRLFRGDSETVTMTENLPPETSHCRSHHLLKLQFQGRGKEVV